MDINIQSKIEKKSTIIKSSIKKSAVDRPVPFVEMKFNMAQISDLLGVAKSSVYNLEKEGQIKSVAEPYGHGERRIYSWEEFAIIARRFRNRIPKPLANKVKVFANLKGGVGKSTIATQMAMTGAAWGFNVLAIDLDPQANMTMGLAGLSIAREDQATVREILIERKAFKEVVKVLTPLLSLIPANLNLSSLERKLASENNRDKRLKQFLDSIRDQYDLIIIDPPSFSRFERKVFQIKRVLPKLLDLSLKILKPQGHVFVSTNYSGINNDYLAKIVRKSSVIAQKSIKGMHPLGQDIDFPSLNGMKESSLAALLVSLR